MSQTHLPAHISTPHFIKDLESSDEKIYLIAVRVQNYFFMETILSQHEISLLMETLAITIKNFIKPYKIPDLQVQVVQNYLFITSKHDISVPPLFQNLKIYLNTYHMDNLPHVHLIFQITSCDGPLKDAICWSVGFLESLLPQVMKHDLDRHRVSDMLEEYRLLGMLKYSITSKTANFAYQPIINSLTGAVEYKECLLRIQDSSGKSLSAGPAIELAEKYGIIDIVDEAVLDMAVKELTSSKEAKISINISNLGIFNKRLLDKIKSVVKDHRLSERLIVEITETSLNENFPQMAEFINSLQDLGCKVAVDDFGVGVTSFKQLREIKFDIIKIDGSFIKDMVTSTYSRLVVELIVKLSKTIGAKTVAEWVETGNEAKMLLDMGVDFMQGHFFSPAQTFRSWGNK